MKLGKNLTSLLKSFGALLVQVAAQKAVEELEKSPVKDALKGDQ